MSLRNLLSNCCSSFFDVFDAVMIISDDNDDDVDVCFIVLCLFYVCFMFICVGFMFVLFDVMVYVCFI